MKRFYSALALLVVVGTMTALIVGLSQVGAQGGEGTAEPGEGDAVTYTWAGDVHAPDFPQGLEWINVSQPIKMAELRGKIVLLDFWTYGCINCIHVIPDLKRLEAEYSNELVVIGVHSAKFDNEGETENIRRIVRRYEVAHPVVNDNQFEIWNSYGVQAWPTFMLIDPLGKVVGQLSGEPLYDRIQPIIDVMASEFTASGVINTAPLTMLKPELASMESTPLRFPGKILADPEGNRLFIADSNHNRIVVTSLDTYEVLDVIGSGEEGLLDGDFATAQFFRPQGMALVNNKLFVADTENHAIRQIDLEAQSIVTVAGTGAQGFNRGESGPGLEMELNSPWDVVVVDGQLYIAMAGPHQLWVYDLALGEVGPYAGSGSESLTDGKLLEAGMAQPSGIDTDGTVLYFTDPEASAIRTADLDPNGEVKTIVGTGLFDFGDVDGVGDEVRLQHALGVTVADDGYLYIADTYNNKIKRIDPAARESLTFAGTGEEGSADGDLASAQFYEPGGLDYANGKLYIADTNNNAIRVIDLAAETVTTVNFPNVELLTSEAPQAEPGVGSGFGAEAVTLAPQMVAPGEGTIQINVTMPDGYKYNDQAPFTAIWLENAIAQIPDESRAIRIVHPEMPLDVPVTFSAGQTDLTVELTIYWCEAVNETLCFVKRAQLTVPLSVTATSSEHRVGMDYTLVPPVVNNTLQ
ncbi:MAG TPA: thioredoxin-like domain-containing protein [Aggregatilineaceae bacterium]|nr:thioredoxin-like domain-containing protein [Aggregatilineaceae bacterium]